MTDDLGRLACFVLVPGNAAEAKELDTLLDGVQTSELNLFADLKQFRSLATRYCKLASRFRAMVLLAGWFLATKGRLDILAA